MDFKVFLTRKRDEIKRKIPEKNISDFQPRTSHIPDFKVAEKMCYKNFTT